MDKGALGFPTFGECEVAAIGCYGVLQPCLCHYIRGIVIEGIVHINIIRCTVALHLEASGNGYVVP